MSKPVLESLFSFSCRRDRKSYAWLSLLLLILVMAGAGVGALVGDASGMQITTWPGLILILLSIIIGLTSSAQRCHDFRYSGWLILILIIPVIGTVFQIALFFIPGSKGPNRYGADPRGDPRLVNVFGPAA